MEFAGWKCQKVNLPPSPKSGAKGKRIVCLRHMDHPYTTAYTKGMKKVADAYGIQLKTLTAGNADVNIQSQQVDQVINERPDLVIIFPVDAKSVVPMLRKLNQAGIPTIASNLLPVDSGMPYTLCWLGPVPHVGPRVRQADELRGRVLHRAAHAGRVAVLLAHVRGGDRAPEDRPEDEVP
jgi:ribose transport system substrate-binding protein